MTPTLETPRLILRPLETADAPQIQALFPQWEIVKYLANVVPWPYPPDGASAFVARAQAAVEAGEAWHWTLRPKSSPEQLIGSIGVFRNADTHRGFWIDPRWQGRGLMTEAADAVTDFWFNVLKLPVLRTNKAVENKASSRITEKQGMRLLGIEERDYVCGRLPAEIWVITAEEWRARHQ
jgi:RimJ/RimL family protein N-acetyltransferase